jgi:hypothetical protein
MSRLGQIRSYRRDETWSGSLCQTFFVSCVGAVLSELPLSVYGCRKFQLDPLCDLRVLYTCTAHSGVKKKHEWVVDQISDLIHTTHRVKTQQVGRRRGQRCGDIELVGYPPNAVGPVPLVLDPRKIRE